MWKMVVLKMNNQDHLNLKGLEEIIALKASINLGLSKNLKNSFPDIIPFKRPFVSLPNKLNPHWLAGFTEGEGYFVVEISDPEKILLNYLIG